MATPSFDTGNEKGGKFYVQIWPWLIEKFLATFVSTIFLSDAYVSSYSAGPGLFEPLYM